MDCYCTLFDSNFFSRGLAMYYSLAEVHKNFTLYIFCFDDRVHRILTAMCLPHVVPVSLAEFETPALLAVKPSRTGAEYCWTCTPRVIRHVLDQFDVQAVTYLDADLYFFSSPEELVNEYIGAGASVMITGHRFARSYMKSVVLGIYCVQFMSFKADERGLNVLSWWEERCLEWCYNRLEDGKFGDQLYLDDWPERFDGVHVLQHRGGGIAPWNAVDYLIQRDNNVLLALHLPSAEQSRLIFYHFHNLRFNRGSWLDLGHYPLPAESRDLLYPVYLRALVRAGSFIADYDSSFDPHGFSVPESGVMETLKRLRKRLYGNYYRYSDIKEIPCGSHA